MTLKVGQRWKTSAGWVVTVCYVSTMKTLRDPVWVSGYDAFGWAVDWWCRPDGTSTYGHNLVEPLTP